MILKKSAFYAIFVLLFAGIAGVTFGQDRELLVKQISSRAINPPVKTPGPDPVKRLVSHQPSKIITIYPTLAKKLNLKPIEAPQSLIKRTGSSDPVKIMSAASGRMLYNPSVTGEMHRKINAMIGIPYRYGSTGPNRYDCSGFVWAVFNSAGIGFGRTSARVLWNTYEPVSGDERYKFGTLVFFNRLGHVGIVADENGFYHASSSKGITYSKFAGYWSKRIVGFRRIPSANPSPALN
ncbi:MAG: C40 family peptidase [Pyrinomonadaceae bacterium]